MWILYASLTSGSDKEVGFIESVVMMKNWVVSFQAIALSLVATLAITTVGCMKPSLRNDSVETGAAHTGSLTIWHDSFEAAREQALVSGKPILADFTGSDWCSWCVKLHDDVFSKSDFEAWARDNVVLLELDYPQRSRQTPAIQAQNEKLASLYRIDSYPTVMLLDAQGNELARSGYQPNPEALIDKLGSQLQ